MTAIVLVAGRGRRLGPITATLPKCLVPVGGTAILTYMLDRIERAGMREVVLAVGFEAERIRRHVAELSLRNLQVRFVDNPRFAETNNLYSLSLALKETAGPFTVLNGDDLFHVEILKALQHERSEAAAVVDFSRPLTPDAMKVTLDGSRVTSLGKQIPAHLAAGNAIGLYRFRGDAATLLRAEIQRWVARGQVNDFYVSAISAVASRMVIRAAPTAGLTWCEVDDARDLAAAQANVMQILTEEACRVTSRDVARPQGRWHGRALAAAWARQQQFPRADEQEAAT